MIGGEYTLELCNVSHSGQVEPSSCFQQLTGGVKIGVILKDVSFSVHAGEVVAVLGSKGSGKRALLDVIARRVPSRGRVLLEGAPLEPERFRGSCALVRHSARLLPGLTVQQTLAYSITHISGYLKSSKVKQVLADLALSQVAHKNVAKLTKSEYRRLVIGVQLIRDPVILLLDEPTWELDPLNTYLVVSILANAAKKYGAAIILTMEKPRSDVFPFLERVVYLCLGDVVYAGPTRTLLDYFAGIGFPCPQLENPLMYYLCLSTVDRRSRDRFVESNHQIAALVDRFRLEGAALAQAAAAAGPGPGDPPRVLSPARLHPRRGGPGGPGGPGELRALWTLYVRMLASVFNLSAAGVRQVSLRLLALPLYCGVLWLFYYDAKDYQRAFITKSGLIFNTMAGAYFISILNTVSLFGAYRTRYYQESQEGLYSGASLLLSYDLVSLPFSFLSTLAATAIVYPVLYEADAADVAHEELARAALALWACYLLAEQQTMAVMMVVRAALPAAAASVALAALYLVLAGGVLRSYRGYDEWLYYLTYATQSRYASVFLHRGVFARPRYALLPPAAGLDCAAAAAAAASCPHASGEAYLAERFSPRGAAAPGAEGDLLRAGDLRLDFNLGVTFAFAVGGIVGNLLLYLVPLPARLKDKFRE